MSKKIIIKLTKPEKGWEKYGDIDMLIEIDGKPNCGGTFKMEEGIKIIKQYCNSLEKEKKTLYEKQDTACSICSFEMFRGNDIREHLKEFIKKYLFANSLIKDSEVDVFKKAKEIFGDELIK